MTTQIILYANVKPLILEADSVQTVKELADQAQAWATYWAAKKDRNKALQGALSYVLAAFKGGELLDGLEKSTGGYPTHASTPSSVAGVSQYARTLEAAKLSESTAKRWQRIARAWTLEAVDDYLSQCVEQDKIPTLQYLLRQSRAEDRRVIATDLGSWQVEPADVESLAFVADASVDVIITDPPYPREYLGVYSALSKTAERVLKPGGSCFVMVGQSYLPELLSRLSECLAYHWTLAYLTPGGQSVQLFQRHVNTFWKPLLWFVKGRYTGKWLGDVCQGAVNDNDKTHHEWGQSESGMLSIVGSVSERGQTILDPFCGAGTTGVAAVSLGRYFIGSDRDRGRTEQTRARLQLLTGSEQCQTSGMNEQAGAMPR